MWAVILIFSIIFDAFLNRDWFECWNLLLCLTHENKLGMHFPELLLPQSTTQNSAQELCFKWVQNRPLSLLPAKSGPQNLRPWNFDWHRMIMAVSELMINSCLFTCCLGSHAASVSPLRATRRLFLLLPAAVYIQDSDSLLLLQVRVTLSLWSYFSGHKVTQS